MPGIDEERLVQTIPRRRLLDAHSRLLAPERSHPLRLNIGRRRACSLPPWLSHRQRHDATPVSAFPLSGGVDPEASRPRRPPPSKPTTEQRRRQRRQPRLLHSHCSCTRQSLIPASWLGTQHTHPSTVLFGRHTCVPSQRSVKVQRHRHQGREREGRVGPPSR